MKKEERDEKRERLGTLNLRSTRIRRTLLLSKVPICLDNLYPIFALHFLFRIFEHFQPSQIIA